MPYRKEDALQLVAVTLCLLVELTSGNCIQVFLLAASAVF